MIRKSTRGQSTIKNKERGGVGQILTRICVSRERLGEAIYFVNNKKQPLRFTRVFWFASNKLWRVNPRVQLFVASKCRLRLNEKKLSNRLTAALLKDCRLKDIENSKYQLIFATAEEVLSKPFLSWLKKKTAHRFTHRLYVS